MTSALWINTILDGILGAVVTVAAALLVAWFAGRLTRQNNAIAQQNTAIASTLAEIERGRRHSELCPRLRVIFEPWSTGSTDVWRLRVALMGPPGLDRLDTLTSTIRNDHFRRGDGPHNAASPTPDQVKAHIWGPYQFRPGTGDAGATADSTGRTITYDDGLPSGEELVFTLEHTRPPAWSTGATQADWDRERGGVLRLAFTASHTDHGTWTLPCEIDTGDGTTRAAARIPEV